MIDIHSHILAGLDDGAKRIEESVEMLRVASRNGTRKIFATPHYYRGWIETPYSKVIKSVKKLNSIIEEKEINIEVIPGQEVFLTSHIVDDYREKNISTLALSKYMLIELPFDNLPKDALSNIYEIKLQGIVPIIAHFERYQYAIKDPSIVNRFIDEGCLFQMNASGIDGRFGKKSQETAQKLLKSGVYSFIGSDAHNTTNRMSSLEGAVSEIRKIDKTILADFEANGEKIIRNEDIEFNGEKITKKRKWFMLQV